MMRHDCPYCGVSLKGKLIKSVPAPNERRFPPSRAIPICRACKGMLQYNTHPSELFSLVLLLPFIVCLLFKKRCSPLSTHLSHWPFGYLSGLLLKFIYKSSTGNIGHVAKSMSLPVMRFQIDRNTVMPRPSPPSRTARTARTRMA